MAIECHDCKAKDFRPFTNGDEVIRCESCAADKYRDGLRDKFGEMFTRRYLKGDHIVNANKKVL